LTRAHQAVPQNGADPDAAGLMDRPLMDRVVSRGVRMLQIDHSFDCSVPGMESSDSEDDSEDDLDTEDDLSGSVGGEATDFHEHTAVVADNVVRPSAAWAPAPPPELARRCKKWRTPNI